MCGEERKQWKKSQNGTFIELLYCCIQLKLETFTGIFSWIFQTWYFWEVVNKEWMLKTRCGHTWCSLEMNINVWALSFIWHNQVQICTFCHWGLYIQCLQCNYHHIYMPSHIKHGTLITGGKWWVKWCINVVHYFWFISPLMRWS